MKKCPKCGIELIDEARFCENCGEKLSDTSKKKADTRLNPFLLLGIVGVLIIMYAFFSPDVRGKHGGAPGVCYVKKNSIYYTNFLQNDPFRLTKNLYKEVTNEETSEITDEENTQEEIIPLSVEDVKFSKDNKYVFYPENRDNATYTLSMRKLNKPRLEPVKIDSDVDAKNGYYLSENGKKVYYVKDGHLYVNDFSQKTKIASFVTDFTLSKKNDVVFFLDDENKLCKEDKKGNRERIDSEVCEYHVLDDKGTTVVYLKNDELFYKKDNKDKAKLASNVCSVKKVYDDGSFFFVTKAEEPVSSLDVIEDDCRENDDAFLSGMEVPEGYFLSKDPSFYANEINEREKIRETNFEIFDLMYFDGKSLLKVESHVFDYEISEEEPYAIVSYLKDEKVLMSKIFKTFSIENPDGSVSFPENFSEKYPLLLGASHEYFYDGSRKKLSFEEFPLKIFLGGDRKAIYYLAGQKLKEEGLTYDVYKYTFSGKKNEKLLENTDGRLYSSNSLIYYQPNGERFDMYINGMIVNSDCNSIPFVTKKNGDVLYLTECNADETEGTLNILKNGKISRIGEKVYYFDELKDGLVIYGSDYNSESDYFEFHCKNKTGDKVLDEKVSFIFLSPND